MKFTIHGARMGRNGLEHATFVYDNQTSLLHDSAGNRIVNPASASRNSAVVYEEFKDVSTPAEPVGKSAKVRDLKIQLGLSCNYSCEYCSQRFVPHAENGTPDQVEKFMRNLDLWLEGEPEKIEFWGGEPFVYWKTLRPLAEALRMRFPNSQFQTITNGSLLTKEINEWLERMEFHVGISHDGPGQPVRGPDPLLDPEVRAAILDLYDRLSPKGAISFNSMVHRENMDRAKIVAYFKDLLGHDRFSLGEGGYIDPYDEGGDINSLRSRAEQLGFRRLTIDQTRRGLNANMDVARKRTREWIDSISTARPASALGQKCQMDRMDTLAVDLKGNVLTCQNVSAAAVAPNGRGHKIGHVSRMNDVKLRTARHWSTRDDCRDCPVLQLCKGSCMFLEGELFRKACDNAYSDHVPFMAKALETMTGFLPYRIERQSGDPLPEERMDLWGRQDEESVVPATRASK